MNSILIACHCITIALSGALLYLRLRDRRDAERHYVVTALIELQETVDRVAFDRGGTAPEIAQRARVELRPEVADVLRGTKTTDFERALTDASLNAAERWSTR